MSISLVFSLFAGYFFIFCCCLLTFFQNIFQEYYQNVIPFGYGYIGTDVLISVQTVGKDYQQPTKVLSSKERDTFFCYIKLSPSPVAVSLTYTYGILGTCTLGSCICCSYTDTTR